MIEQIQKEMALQEKLNANGKINVPSAEHIGGSDQILKDITIQEQLGDNCSVSPINGAKGTVKSFYKDIEITNAIKGSETVDSPVWSMSQIIHRDVEVK